MAEKKLHVVRARRMERLVLQLLPRTTHNQSRLENRTLVTALLDVTTPTEEAAVVAAEGDPVAVEEAAQEVGVLKGHREIVPVDLLHNKDRLQQRLRSLDLYDRNHTHFLYIH